jgi:DNA-binding response OmpR family regulator
VHKVLIVEDDVDLRRMFKTALSFGGYEVLEAGDGLQALRHLESSDLDGMVLDLGLPLVSGHVVLQEVAANAHARQVPVVVVVTAQPGPYQLPHASCVLTKPVTPERLVGTVRRCLASGSSSSVV